MSDLRKDLAMIAAIFIWGTGCSLAFFWLIGVPDWLLGLWGKWFVFFLILVTGATVFPHLLKRLSNSPEDQP